MYPNTYAAILAVVSHRIVTYNLAVVNNLGNRIREARNAAGLTQPQMAESLGLSLRTYQKYEEGSRRPPLDTLVNIALKLHVSTDWLLGIGDSPFHD